MATVHAPELLIIMSGSATTDEIEQVVERLEEAGARRTCRPARRRP